MRRTSPHSRRRPPPPSWGPSARFGASSQSTTKKQTSGSNPGLLVFGSRLTTYAVLDELNARGIDWLTLRQRGKATLAELAALPASAWKTYRIDRAGRYRHSQIHEDMVTIAGIDAPVRQIAVRNIGRGEPTLL